MKLLQLSIGMPKVIHTDGGELVSGICKEKTASCFVTKSHIEGDDVANHEFHGGTDRVICVYPFEHYADWERQFQMKLARPAFGENLLVEGMKESDTFIGDVYRIGDAVLQVSQGRIPCSTIDIRNQCKGLLAAIVKTGYTGYFMRVLEEGMMYHDAKITLVERNDTSVSILQANQIYFHGPRDSDSAQRLLEIETLAEGWRSKLQKRINTSYK